MERLCLRFQDISVSEKMLYSLFLMTIGIGYLFALTHMYYTHQMRDGQPGMSIQDVMIAYYGSQEQTRLSSAINGGPMEPNLKSADDKEKILVWLTTGKEKEDFKQNIAPILNRDCIVCHNSQANPGLPNLTTYQGVLEVASSKAAPLPSLVKISHIHLFGIAFILLFVGRIFIYCDMSISLKRIIVVIPFLSMLIDTFSWFVTRSFPNFAYIVVASGALMGLSMGAQIVISLYQMWSDKLPLLLTDEQQERATKYILTGLTFSKDCIVKYAPVVWNNGVALSLSLLHISRYALHPELVLSDAEQTKAQQYTNILQTQGYSVWFANKGWLVKKSLLSWLFFSSINDLENYTAKTTSSV